MEAVSDIAGAISKYAWIEENKGYSLFVFDRGDGYYKAWFIFMDKRIVSGRTGSYVGYKT